MHFGTQGTACLDATSGEVVWRNDQLRLDHKEGPGSSPVLCGDLLIINCDGIDAQYIVALDKRTGHVAWKTNRTGANNPNNDFRKAYSTPLVIEAAGRRQVISVGAERVYAYDPIDGREIWWVNTPGFSTVPRPIYGPGMVYVCTGYMKPQLWAIRPDGSGDVGATHVAWRAVNQAPASPSPVLVDGLLFMVSDQGIATCLDAQQRRGTGQDAAGRQLLGLAAGCRGRIYCFNESGECVVVGARRGFENPRSQSAGGAHSRIAGRRESGAAGADGDPLVSDREQSGGQIVRVPLLVVKQCVRDSVGPLLDYKQWHTYAIRRLPNTALPTAESHRCAVHLA